ncbi:MAG TPA: Gamma-glutamyltranspeptidase, partial [Rhizobiales bacterium]|nr:Gamma-glutamyltranspeptidase [Hyphomicrobiales bacterium]
MKHPSKGAVAAGHELTAQAMKEILLEGGNAFDAAIAGAFMACVAEPVLAAPGGGGFCMIHEAASGKFSLLDFFAQTPRNKTASSDLEFFPITADFGTATQEFHIGAGAAATPGFAQGLCTLHERLGKLPLPRIAEPAVRAARKGVEVSRFQAGLFQIISPILISNPCAKAVFAPSGRLLTAGEILSNRALGDTLEALAREGAALFTQGEVGRAMLEQSRLQGGHLQPDDLSGYKVEMRSPVLRRYAGLELYMNPPPSSGGTLIAFALGLLSRMDVRGAALVPALARALDLGDTARRDAGHCLETLSDDAALIACLEKAGRHKPARRGTTHVSAIDSQGNAAALTISNGEGNGFMLGKYGFMLNNMLGEEDLNPHGFQNWPENTRLSSMMAPSLLRSPDGTLTALGSGGSNRIRSAITQVIARLGQGQDLAGAVEAPRLHLEHGHLDFEDFFTDEQRASLLAAFPDHRGWKKKNMFFGGVHAVSCDCQGRFLT